MVVMLGILYLIFYYDFKIKKLIGYDIEVICVVVKGFYKKVVFKEYNVDG